MKLRNNCRLTFAKLDIDISVVREKELKLTSLDHTDQPTAAIFLLSTSLLHSSLLHYVTRIVGQKVK